MNRMFLVIIAIVFSCTPAKATEHLAGIIGLLLDENRIVVFEENFFDQSDWEFSSESFGYDPDFGMDAGAQAVIRDQKLIVSAYENCGSASASANRLISNPKDVDNIQWRVKIETVGIEGATGILRLNYGSVNIALSLGNLPFDMLYQYVDNVILVIDYNNGVLTARANGKPMAAEVTVGANADSNIEISTSASAADCGASVSVVITSIKATAVLKNSEIVN